MRESWKEMDSSHPHHGPHVGSAAAGEGSQEAAEIDHDFESAGGDQEGGVVRLKPTPGQWLDFPLLLARARELGAEADGCFKLVIPPDFHSPLPPRPVDKIAAASAYRVRQVRKSAFWRVSAVPSEGCLAPGAEDYSGSIEAALDLLKRRFRSCKGRRIRGVLYQVDVPAWTLDQRREAGVPDRSPIHPLGGDGLDGTRAIIPGIHTPYVYQSGSTFGAPFQIHTEDFRLASLNHLYFGRKIWIVVPPAALAKTEEVLGREGGCSQFMRHRAQFLFPDSLRRLGIPYRLIDQRPGETVVIFPDAYHEGFSTGYTMAEARNYATPGWDPKAYHPCGPACNLPTAIPDSFMRPLEEGEERIDLCLDEGTPAAEDAGKRKKRPPRQQADATSGKDDDDGDDGDGDDGDDDDDDDDGDLDDGNKTEGSRKKSKA